jgi:HK97 family phage prohead protease
MLIKSAAAAIKVRDFGFEELELKEAANGKGWKITGYGSVFGNKDSYGEVVERGAFSKSILKISERGRKLPMLWQHRSGQPIGVWDRMAEDSKGLEMEGTLLKGVALAEEARILADAGAVTGLSIGYYVRDSSRDEVEKVIRLKELDLEETSLVTFPANDDARVEGVKMQLARGGLPSVKDFESFLRSEFGLSRTRAAAVVSSGYAKLFQREAGGEEDHDAPNPVKSALADLRASLKL